MMPRKRGIMLNVRMSLEGDEIFNLAANVVDIEERGTGNGDNCDSPCCCAKTDYTYFFLTTCVKAEAAADLASLDDFGLLSTLPALLAALAPVVSLRCICFLVMICSFLFYSSKNGAEGN